MKKSVLFLFAVLAVACAPDPAATGTFSLVCPQPQSWSPSSAGCFTFSRGTTVCYPAGNEIMQRNARFLAENLTRATGFPVKTVTRPGRHSIVLSTDPSVADTLEGFQAEQAYTITVTTPRIKISAATEQGVFYGIQTLFKALPVTDEGPLAITTGTVRDWPRFPFRGFMVDVSRHFFSVDYIKELIDILALHGINEFHWHLTDDQGWRIEIPSRPALTAVGSHRRGTITEPGAKTCDDVPVDGFYSADEVREVIAYAAERFIEVIPEIDLPGHMLAALASYPELGCTGGPYEVAWHFGIFDDILCAGKEETLRFALEVLETVMDIFPSRYIHIGGDEAPKTIWKDCPDCQAKIKELGLKQKDGKTPEDQLQTWFMGQIEEAITARGRKMLAWDEILDGTPAPSTTVMGWTSPSASVRAAKEGHEAIVCPIQHLYFSNPRFNQLRGRESIDRVYGFNPVPEQLTPEEAARIIGVEGCIWTEWVADSTKLEWELLPRLAALAELQWSDPSRRDLDDFLPRLRHMTEFYSANGWNWKEDNAEAWAE